MRRLALAVTLVLLAVVLFALGWTRWPREEPAAVTAPVRDIEVGTTATASTTTTPSTTVSATTTAGTTTTAPVPRLVGVSVPLDDTAPAIWWDALLAVSAQEAWVALGVGTSDAGNLVGHFHDGHWTTYEVFGIVLSLARGPDELVWVASSAGVFSFNGSTWERQFGGPAGGVAVGPDGTVWIGGRKESSSVGQRLWLARRVGGSWERVDPSPSQVPGPYGDVSLVVLPGGEVWMAHRAGYWIEDDLTHFDGAAMEQLQVPGIPDATPDNSLPASYVTDIAAASDGLWAVGYLVADPDRAVLARLYGSDWAIYDWPHANPTGPALRGMNLTVGPDGVVWFAFDGGLRSFDGTTWNLYLEGETLYNVAVAPDGTVWFSDAEGIHVLDAP
jgi:hypothetical protein